MAYRLVVSPEAYDELERFIEYIAVEQQLPQTAERWLTKARAVLQTLKTFPNRCPLAPESEYSQHTIRSLIVDSAVFLYRTDEATKTVRVLRFRHSRQAPQRVD